MSPPKRPFWSQERRNYFLIFCLIALTLFILAYFHEVEVEHDGYKFSFPLTVQSAKSLFHLNRKVSNGRIARLNSGGCKEIQVTVDVIIKDSSRANRVEAVSFYHSEDMKTLKETLEGQYGKSFEPVYYYRSNEVHYYFMQLSGFVILLYPANHSTCLNQEATPYEQMKRSNKLSVVAFTPLLTEEYEFNAFVTLDGFWRE